MQVGQPGPSQSHSREWRGVRRDRFADVWQQLSQLTVLAAAPGWGRTTWMTQCRDSMSAADSLWVSDRASFNGALSRLGERAMTLFVDDVLLASSDPGWEQLLDTLERAPGARAIVTTIDDPPATAAQRVSTTVMREADLAFTPDEVTALAALNAPAASIELIGSATTRLRGHPLMTRMQLERARGEEDLVWASPDVPLERQVVGVLDTALAHGSDSIDLARTFRHAVTLRRFSARLLAAAADLPLPTATAAFLLDRDWTTWNMDSGWLHPFDHRFRDIRPTSSIWVRANAQSPWVLDVPLTPFHDGRWTNKKAEGQSMPLDDATWIGDDGLRYLNPEIVLFMKAAQSRRQDIEDAETTLPLLDPRQRAWLREAVSRARGDHPWAQLR